MAQRQQDDACPEQDPFGYGGEGRERDAEIQDRVMEGKMLTRPDRVEPELLRELGDRTVTPRVGKTFEELPGSLNPDLDQSPARRACRHAFS